TARVRIRRIAQTSERLICAAQPTFRAACADGCNSPICDIPLELVSFQPTFNLERGVCASRECVSNKQQRLRSDLTEAITQPHWPTGYRVRAFTAGDAPAVHHLLEVGYAQG